MGAMKQLAIQLEEDGEPAICHHCGTAFGAEDEMQVLREELVPGRCCETCKEPITKEDSEAGWCHDCGQSMIGDYDGEHVCSWRWENHYGPYEPRPEDRAAEEAEWAEDQKMQNLEARCAGIKALVHDGLCFDIAVEVYDSMDPLERFGCFSVKPEQHVLNRCHVVITSNYMAGGLYLPKEDRRHYVAESPRGQSDFSPDYWKELWTWFREADGYEHVAAYLHAFNLRTFEYVHAPPPKTAAFWALVGSNSSPETAAIENVLDDLGRPGAVSSADYGASD